jgi:hypothetical protein
MNNFYNNAVKIGFNNGVPIFLWLFSFSEIVLNRSFYNNFFSEQIIDILMKSSGAMAFKAKEYYGIIVNSDGFSDFNDETKNFIITHEYGHIMRNEFNMNKCKIKRIEHNADTYAKEHGFKLKTSIFKLTKWEIFSLIPKCPYNDSKFFIWLFRIFIFVKHYLKNIKRIYKNK